MKEDFSQTVDCHWAEILLCAQVLVKSYSDLELKNLKNLSAAS